MISKLDFQFNNVPQGSSDHALAEAIMIVSRKVNEVITAINNMEVDKKP